MSETAIPCLPCISLPETLDFYRALGFESDFGTIEAGKIANIVVAKGDPLEIRTELTHVFIKGQSVGLDTRQVELYKKYSSRP